ncbi:MAG: type II toxin-antitoxin system RelE/ParE family toxin [Paludibacteraceae bacterium]|nr:type II toxin-antitoxin system RelE/ParE family toxin [Paludibacteraceae bacterium]MBR6077391.1 type II toxin-antitoxin system RelE/ParE family toxin [Paludibacteraceae bacterium]
MAEDVREIYYSEEYEEYYRSLEARIQEKFDYVEHIIRTQKVLNSKFVKKLEGTEFYEARVSCGSNEYRTVLFAIDAASIIESKSLLFLNSFLKKSTRQYKFEVRRAEGILSKYKEE